MVVPGWSAPARGDGPRAQMDQSLLFWFLEGNHTEAELAWLYFLVRSPTRGGLRHLSLFTTEKQILCMFDTGLFYQCICVR